MIDQDDIRLLREIGEEQRSELVGTSPARTSDSESDGEVAATSSPANCYYVFNGCAHPQFCKLGCAASGFSSGLDASP